MVKVRVENEVEYLNMRRLGRLQHSLTLHQFLLIECRVLAVLYMTHISVCAYYKNKIIFEELAVLKRAFTRERLACRSTTLQVCCTTPTVLCVLSGFYSPRQQPSHRVQSWNMERLSTYRPRVDEQHRRDISQYVR